MRGSIRQLPNHEMVPAPALTLRPHPKVLQRVAQGPFWDARGARFRDDFGGQLRAILQRLGEEQHGFALFPVGRLFLQLGENSRAAPSIAAPHKTLCAKISG